MAERKPPLTVAQHRQKFGSNSVASFRREPARKASGGYTSHERHTAARETREKNRRLRESLRRHTLNEG